MRRVFMGLAVVASLATSLTGANAQCDFLSTLLGCNNADIQATATADRQASDDHMDDQMDELFEQERYEEAYEADQWADTYLAGEKAAAVYWRDSLVQLDTMNGKRTGRLGTPEGRYIYESYVCDINYDDAQSGGCVPADRDYDCSELRSWGIVNIPVRTPVPGTSPPMTGDWMLLDDDHDGLGCEFEPAAP